MKNIIFVLFLLSSITLTAQNDQFTVNVDGMGCAYCANGVDKKLKEWKELSALEIDLATGLVKFEYPSSENLTADQVHDQILAAGYTVTSVQTLKNDGKTDVKVFKKTPTVASNKGLKKLHVKGTCDMCTNRIENAASSVKGISNVSYNLEEQTLSFKLNPKKATIVQLEQALAAVGHDTENLKASDDVYHNLHSCCKYDRN